MNLDICRHCRYWKEKILVDPYRENVTLELVCNISEFADFSVTFRRERVGKFLEAIFDCKSIDDYYEKVKDVRPYNANALDRISNAFKRQYNSTMKHIANYKIPMGCPYDLEQFISELNK